MLAFLSVLLLAQIPGQSWHYEKVCNGRECVLVKVYNPPPPANVVARPAIGIPERIVVPPAPVVQPLPPDRQYFFGVADDKLSDRDRYCVGDREVTKAELHAAFDAYGSDLLPDDTSKPYLTFFGKDEPTRKAIEDMVAAAELAPVRDHYRIQVYDWSHKVDSLVAAGFNLDAHDQFAKSGRVGVVQYPTETGDSKAVGVVWDFQTPAELLAAVPRADPKFRLPKIPGEEPRSSSPASLLVAVAVFAAVFVATAIACLFFPSPPTKE